MVTKASGVDFEYAKQLALKVIIYLLYGMIPQNMKHNDIVRMKRPDLIQASKKV